MSLYILWMVLFLAFLSFEIVTPGTFFFLCFSVGCLFATVAVLIGSSFFASIIVFCFFSLISIFLIRPLLIKYFKSKKLEKSNIDAVVGSTVKLMEPISGSNAGKVKISGEIWLAVSNENIEAGSMVKVNAVDGTKLIVEKFNG